MAAGERGFCGLRQGVSSSGGRTRIHHLGGTSRRGVLQWYRDPLPTNCVSDWVCPGHQRAGMHNLAVFYASCTLDCLYCQNWHFRAMDAASADTMSARDLAACATERTFCVCFFGGDPASQMPHALAVSRLLAERGVRVCWETAGTQRAELMDRAVELSLSSGGTVKFDLKAFDEGLHIALTGASNRRTLDNFARAARRAAERPAAPLVIASTLLVPGYVTPEEVGRIAAFIADIDPAIPYALLAFAPQFFMRDLRRTSRRHAEEAEAAAREAGVTNVRIGNHHLLW
jgi:pyruvate formate lyase activating enzyme